MFLNVRYIEKPNYIQRLRANKYGGEYIFKMAGTKAIKARLDKLVLK